jgi:hypothetical protein
MRAVFRQPRGEGTPGRSRSDDDEICFHPVILPVKDCDFRNRDDDSHYLYDVVSDPLALGDKVNLATPETRSAPTSAASMNTTRSAPMPSEGYPTLRRSTSTQLPQQIRSTSASP